MNAEEVKEQVERKAAVFATCFGTAAGKEVLDTLIKANPAGGIFDADTNKMARNVGAFEVVQGILELVNRGKKNV